MPIAASAPCARCAPGKLEPHVRLRPLVGDAELGAVQPVVANLPPAEARGLARAEADDLAGELLDDRRDALVVDVQDGDTVAGKVARQRELLALDRLHAAELLEVCGADVEDRAHARLGDTAELRDLALAVHRHLQHRDLVVALQAHQGEGQPLAGVQVSRAVVRAEVGVERRRRQLLRRGLSHRPRDACHANTAAPPPVAREHGHGRAGVADEGERAVGPVAPRRPLADGRRRSPRQRFVDEIVAVEPLAAESGEQVAWLRQAGVGRPAGDRRGRALDHAVAAGAHAL